MALTQTVGESNVLYLSIAQGNLVQKSDKDNPEARKRTWTDDDGNEKHKWEIWHRNLTGRITDLKIKDGKFGKELLITIQSGEDKAVVQVSVNSDYFTDFAQRLPSVDLTKDVVINPYDIENEGDKRNSRGISIKQNGESVKNYYFDYENKKSINGIPSVSEEEREDMESDDWKVHFIKVNKFLRNQVEKIEIPNYTPPKSEEPVATKTKPKSKPKAASTGEVDDDPWG